MVAVNLTNATLRLQIHRRKKHVFPTELLYSALFIVDSPVKLDLLCLWGLFELRRPLTKPGTADFMASFLSG